MLDSVVRVIKKYCLQALLEEPKYEIKKNKVENESEKEPNNDESKKSSNESDSDKFFENYGSKDVILDFYFYQSEIYECYGFNKVW